MNRTRILILEDDRVVARDIEEHLARLGYAVVASAPSGRQALRLARRLRPDLVLMDIRLEGPTDGVRAARLIRARLRVPVVYLTAYADEQTLRRARVTEPFGYVLKPFEERELRTVIEMALYKHRAERRLRQSERRYAVTLNSIGDAVITADTAGRVTFMNPVAEALTGWPAAEAAGRPLRHVFHAVDERTRQELEDPAARVLRLGRVVGLAGETLLLARDGREVPIDESGAPIIDDRGGVTGVVLVFHDVTQRRRAEAALRESEERFRSVFEAARVGMAITDLEGRFLEVNRSYEEMVGYTAEEFQRLALLDVTHPDDRPHHREVVAELASGRREAHHFEKRCLHKDGTPVWAHATYSTVKDEKGRPRFLVGMVVDITERKRAEEALVLFRALIDRANDLIEVVDPDTGRVLDVNEAACLAHGYSREEYLALSVPDIETVAVDPSTWAAEIGELRRSRHRIFEGRHRHKDGSTFPVEVNVNYISLNRDYLVAVVRDITERRRAEAEREALHRQVAASRRRLQTLSGRLIQVQEEERRRLARELHDEIGQILTAVHLNLEAARQTAGGATRGRLAEGMRVIERAIEQVRNLSLDLRPAMLDIMGLEHALRWYIDRQLKQGGLEVEFVSTLSGVREAPELETACFRVVQEALTNVFRHARARRARVELSRGGDALRLRIQDDGVGFDVGAAFQRASRGETFGLLGIQERVQLLGGRAEIESAPGGGTSVWVHLPAGRAGGGGGREASHETDPRAGGR